MPIYSSTLTKTGQVFLPKAVRSALNLLPGQSVVLSLKGDSLVLKRAQSVEELVAELEEIRENASEKTKLRLEKNAGKSAQELRENWSASPEGKSFYGGRYGL
ncbi:AbrB/MazE/SpoVT family DNA-binding domain-containing protein [Candidatus Saccharibacteria bacterium]|nr:AbrB/MazE/SpoVT family DNA-binding domain-containing protein [Candidatus Saccharibacteria bacterium]